MKNTILNRWGIVLVAAIITLLSAISASAQLSTKGTDFWLGFSPNFDPTGQLKVYITSDVATTGTLSIPLGTFTQNFTIPANSSVEIVVPLAEAYYTGSEIIRPMGIHVVANNPVSVYGLNVRPFSSDASGILPTPALGTSYRVAGARAESQNSQFLIAAVQDNTTVTITPSVGTLGGRPAGSPFQVVLNQGQTYQVQSAGAINLNGTLLTSTAPIAVFSGAICTNISGCGFCDHIYEQNMPTNRLGQRFIIIPLALRTAPIVYDVVATENGTQVSRNGVLSSTLNAGQTFNFTSTQREVITSTAPVAVMQYSPGSACDGVNSDPFVVYVPPVDQMIDKITFEAFVTPNIPSYFVTIITSTANTGNVRLDGAPVTGFTTIPNDATMSAVVTTVLGGTHTLDGGVNGQVSATVYGYGTADSYGYLAGTSALALRGSDIIATPVFTYLQNIPYTTFQAADITSANSAAVMGLTVRDGGATSPDADAFPTTLNSLTIQVTNPDMVRRLALYNGITEVAELAVPANGIVQFTGLNVTTPDNGTVDLTLRATFTAKVVDNTQLTFTVVNAVAATGGTEFRDPNAGGAVSSTVGDNNRLEVIADRLRFTNQPSNVNVGATMQPDVVVRAEDINQNIDFDLEGGEVTVSNAFLNGSPVSALLSATGTATYGVLTFNTAATSQTLLAQSEGLANATSNLFNINGASTQATKIVWLQGTGITGVNDGQTLQTWIDDAGTDDNPSQANAGNRPTYRSTGAFTINGLPTLQFGYNTGMCMPARPEVNGGGEKVIFAVFRTGSNVLTRQVLVELGGVNSGFSMYVANNNCYAGAWDYTGNNIGVWISRSVTPNSVYLAQFVYNGSALKLSAHRAPSGIGTATNVDFPDSFIPNSNQGNGIGSSCQQARYHNGTYVGAGLSDAFLGSIAEIIITNESDVAARTQVLDYLNGKYGIGITGQPIPKYAAVEESEVEPANEGELTVYPNPSNDETVISYFVPVESPVRLQIQNVLGETVAILEEGIKPEGAHQSVFYSGNIPAGMYRAVLLTPTGSISTQLIIQR